MDSTRKRMLESIDAGNFLEAVYNIYSENHDNRAAIGIEVAALHNAGHIDAIAEFSKLNRSDQAHKFFTIRHALEEALPHLEAPVSSVMNCVKYLTLEAGNDLAANMLINPFIEFCKAKPCRAEEVLLTAIENPDDNFDFITPGIIAGSTTDLSLHANKAIELCTHESITIRTKAVYALGRINYSSNTELPRKALSAIHTAIHAHYDEALFSAALRTVFSLFIADNSNETTTTQLIEYILKNGDEHSLHAVSEILAFEKGNIPPKVIDLLLGALVKTKPQNTRTLDNIDYGICALLKESELNKIIPFLDKLLLQNDNNIKITQFDSFTREVLLNKDNALNILITHWLLSNEVRLGRCAADLLSDTSDTGIILKADLNQLKELTKGAHYFLSKKACGWLFLSQVSAASFISSLIDSAPEDEIQPICDILFNPILISYPGSIKQYLEDISKSSSSKLKPIIMKLLSLYDSYREGLNSTRNISELLPTQAQRESHHRHQSRLMNKSFKDARKGFMSELFGKPLVLLYGHKSIHYISHGPDDQKTRQEMPLQSISHSVEFPSLEYLDPHGLDNMLLSFRLARHGS